ncbi:hypothetical protein CCUG62472_04634 [Mycobacteroides salmoniphilum]|uniref:Uncharacterized protein n=1 Tax=Mycobacteroides salmoniphilum TaxID=404941 RepID=A0A4R8SQN9_9MYCO|nr:hypothetical protein CCUG62472_04634 [Mycobacteroides salmoniphilum]TEA01251.1 hypothetical protein CCUG60884_04000 [Mycobacteroides salmoniphilum]
MWVGCKFSSIANCYPMASYYLVNKAISRTHRAITQFIHSNFHGLPHMHIQRIFSQAVATKYLCNLLTVSANFPLLASIKIQYGAGSTSMHTLSLFL